MTMSVRRRSATRTALVTSALVTYGLEDPIWYGRRQGVGGYGIDRRSGLLRALGGYGTARDKGPAPYPSGKNPEPRAAEN